MDENRLPEAYERAAPARPHRARTVLIIGGALALLLVTATAVTAATGWPFRNHNDATTAQAQAPGQGGPMMQGRGGFPGLEGVVTAVDQVAKTLTIAGVPGVTTVTIDANVKLTQTNADGTTQNVALGDFRTGEVVQVHGKIDRSQIQPGQRPDPTKIKLTVTEIVVPPAGVARGSGIVTAIKGNTITVVGMGNLTLNVTPASGATLKKMDGSTFAVGDIKVGDHLTFRGTQSGDAISASDLRLMPQGSFGMGGFGGYGPRGGPGGPGGQGGGNPPGSPKMPSA
ncbi:MAG: hypothetical protein ACR2JW_03915 [Thermomicrobiales bacterium]